MPFVNPPFLMSLPVVGTGSVVWNKRRSPFTSGSQIIVRSVGAATLYGANHPGTLTVTKYARVVNDTAQSTLARATYFSQIPALDTTVAASFTADKVILLNVIKNGTLLERKATDVAPTGTQYRTTDANTLAFATALAVGDVIEIIALSASDVTQIGGGALTANVDVQSKSFDFLSNGVAVTNVIAGICGY